ncbi:MAG: biotin/lipoyl-containing protein, partial [Sedimentibacter sp.]
MAEFIVMPKMGLTMTEGVLTNWKKSEGDEVNKGDTLFDVETDKLTNAYEAKTSGILRKILVSEGTVKVLAPVAIVGNADEDITGLLNQTDTVIEITAEEQKNETTKPQSSSTPNKGGRVKISPRAKKIAQELKVDFNLVVGTSPDGAITEEDIRNYAEKSKEDKKKVSPTAAVVAEQLNVDTNKIEK